MTKYTYWHDGTIYHHDTPFCHLLKDLSDPRHAEFLAN